MTKAKKNMDVAGQERSAEKPPAQVGPTEQVAESRSSPSGKGPLWDTTSHRVRGAMWKHDQKGKARYTIAICRSYKSEDGIWHNVHFFDRNDLNDVVKVAEEAKDYLSQVADKVEAV